MSPRAQRLVSVLASFTKFGLVGLIGFSVDLAVFNLLNSTVLSSDVVHEGPLIAKFVSTTLAIFTNWLGNRNWTFRTHRSSATRREMVEFFVVSVATMPVSLICLWVSHYLLGYTSAFADNMSGMVIGTILGSVLRYVLYKQWVFNPARGSRSVAVTPADGARTPEEDSTCPGGSAGTRATSIPPLTGPIETVPDIPR